ncbi:hypothetical protein [Salinimicrobium sediminilitoris]|uniref:hypothetical protein n=1 Tax=Salinimicrobium sediminilitoris TaxID=2876715 RepID=UPI001E3A8EBE|nr:hypothetical protein [Salinimicrobium sediminilitoris]MCC8361012.1 hypothetical protein [Salinimicrobium sediminilitoris]
MVNYFLFGRRGTEALWDEDIQGVIEAIDDLEAELYIYDPESTPIHEILAAYSRWTDYAYLTKEQYEEISNNT